MGVQLEGALTEVIDGPVALEAVAADSQPDVVGAACDALELHIVADVLCPPKRCQAVDTQQTQVTIADPNEIRAW